ncbi:MAG: T9SS type A sorting domain-containing protein [Bacteroidales bacterium]|nr:T9SS type A sorting domain-containing protein [Bacteroidales bacterium]
MKTLKRIKVLIFFSIYLINIANAQDQSIIELQVKNKGNIPSFIIFKETGKSYLKGQEKDVFKEYLKLTGNDELKKVRTSTDELKFTHEKYQQYYKGVQVEFGEYNIHLKDNIIESMNGEFKRIKDIDISPDISEELALQKAMTHTKAKDFMWEFTHMEKWIKQENNDPQATYYPQAELVIIQNIYGDKAMCLAYKFDIFTNNPLSRNYIYVNANVGTIVNVVPIMINSENNADTKYSGAKHIDTYYDSEEGSYVLRDYSRGNGIEVYNMKNDVYSSNKENFVDNDNLWMSSEWDNDDMDNAALDALWAAQESYDFFWEKYQRNSYDNNGSVLTLYVHYGVNKIASWSNGTVYLGDGNYKYKPLTAIDVVGHEIGHGLNNSHSHLGAYSESGALKEGLADIWGTCIEYFATQPDEKETWLQGEDVAQDGYYCTRSLENPNIKNNPDTYGGMYWEELEGCVPNPYENDNCHVHNNSTIVSHWFYLLSVGKTDSNDNMDYFNVSGIGIEDATDIVYRMETSGYLVGESGYYSARIAALKSARDEFGFNSTQVIQTGRAWHAVGVGDFDFMPTITDSQIRGGSDNVPYNSVNTFYVTPASDALTSSYKWSIIPYTMGCSSTYLPHIIGVDTATHVVIHHGTCTGTYLLRCEARNYWCASYYQDRVITVYSSGGDPGDPDPCDPIMTIYPNPGKKGERTILTLRPPSDDPCDDYPVAYSLETNDVKIFDLSGNLLLHDSFSSDTYSFKNSHFKNGVYIITIKDKKGKKHQKRLTIE